MIVHSAWLKVDRSRPFDSLDFHGAAEDGLGDRDLLSAVNIVAVAAEPLMVLQVDLDDEVARVPVQELMAAVPNPEQHAIVDRFWNLDAEFHHALQDAGALTRFALQVAHAAANATHTHVHVLGGVSDLLAAGAD